MSIHGVFSMGSIRSSVRVLAQRAVVACCVLAVPLVVAIVLPNQAHATPVTYTETGLLTGTLNGVGFTDAAVTITTVADTSNIVPFLPVPGVALYKVSGTTTIQIAGFSLATFNGGDAFGAMSVAGIPVPGALIVAIGDTTTSSGVLGSFVSAPAYDLSTSATYTAAGTGDFTTYSTDAGDLVTIGASGDATFTATVSNVPEPASAMLFGLGTLALAGIRRRRAG